MNNKNDTIIKKEKCTGCQACRQICPQNAILMIEDDEGFLYPVKDEKKCTKCDLCTKICPIINDIEVKNRLKKQIVEVVSHKEKEIVSKSSSGGAFTSIVQAFCDEDYVIFGVSYEDKFKVVHTYVESISDIEKFRKSKYVQSNIKDSYIEVKRFLNQKKKVLFSGTPCQIAGLKKYLNRDYENLLCIDLLCHGVPSQKIFDKYINYMERKHKDNIKRISFREKVFKRKWNSKNTIIEFDKGKKIIENSEENYFLKGFHNNLFHRPSCKECKFANPKRYSDITIADCWGIEQIYSDLDVHEGQSLMIINTEKGKKILEKIHSSQNIRKLTLEFAIQSNSQFRQPTSFNKNRKEFFENLEKIEFDKLIKKYIKTDYKIKIKQIIYYMVPKKIIEKCKKVRRK